MLPSRHVAFTSILLLSLSFVSCDRPSAPPLPQGEQTLAGVVLHALPMSLDRRGTHEILVNGVPQYVAESSMVDLFDHENHPITVRGTFVANNEVDLPPVLVISSVDDALADLKPVDIPSLQVVLSVPSSWRASTAKSITTFTMSGAGIPPLTVFRENLRDLSYDWLGAHTGTGDVALLPYSVSQQRAVRKRDDRTVGVSVEERSGTLHDATVITFLFSRGTVEQPLVTDDLVERILRSVRILSAREVSSSPKSESVQTASGKTVAKPNGPCGGSAGLLCPSGQYCDMSLAVEGVGRCQSY